MPQTEHSSRPEEITICVPVYSIKGLPRVGLMSSLQLPLFCYALMFYVLIIRIYFELTCPGLVVTKTSAAGMDGP